MKRWTLCLAALTVAAMVPAVPAAAASTTTLELVSSAGPYGSADPYTDVRPAGDANFRDAVVVQPYVDYSVLPGTGWVSNPGGAPTDSITLFRRTFHLPAEATGVAVEVCVHADNAVRITLNGVLVGEQPDAALSANYQDPAECYTAAGSMLRPGENVLDFAVHEFWGLMGLNYRAVVTYDERVNTPPVLQLLADITVDATSPQGATVPYSATATDDTGATTSCDPASGSTFPIGVTTVTCTATDADGATASGSFTVTVRGAREQLIDLLAAVTGVGPGHSLAAKIRAVVDRLPDKALPLTCEPLRLFVAAVRAQSGKAIPESTAAEFVADATRIRAVLACR